MGIDVEKVVTPLCSCTLARAKEIKEMGAESLLTYTIMQSVKRNEEQECVNTATSIDTTEYTSSKCWWLTCVNVFLSLISLDRLYHCIG